MLSHVSFTNPPLVRKRVSLRMLRIWYSFTDSGIVMVVVPPWLVVIVPRLVEPCTKLTVPLFTVGIVGLLDRSL